MTGKITMAHGSGGKSGAELMEKIFGRYFSNEVLDKMEDAAVLDIQGRIAFSTDSFVVTPYFFKGGDIGKLALCGTANDLAMMGAVPKYITCAFIMEEGLPIEDLDKIAKSLAEAAKDAGVKVVAGDTKVVEGSGGLYINTTGIGIIPEGRNVRAGNCRKGDKIILSGTLGDHHACILSSRMEMENDIKSDCAFLGHAVEQLFAAGIDIHTMRDVTRGGLGTIINELAASSGAKIRLEEKSLPVKPEVKGFCGILGLDPLYMGNEGKMILAVDAADAQRALDILKDTAVGKDAAVIGEVLDAGEPEVTMVTPLGGSRIVDVLYGEGLPRIC